MHRRSLVRILATLTALLPAGAGATLPDRVVGTYFGGAGSEAAYAMALDGVGNLYVCGFSEPPVAMPSGDLVPPTTSVAPAPSTAIDRH